MMEEMTRKIALQKFNKPLESLSEENQIEAWETAKNKYYKDVMGNFD